MIFIAFVSIFGFCVNLQRKQLLTNFRNCFGQVKKETKSGQFLFANSDCVDNCLIHVLYLNLKTLWIYGFETTQLNISFVKLGGARLSKTRI